MLSSYRSLLHAQGQHHLTATKTLAHHPVSASTLHTLSFFFRPFSSYLGPFPFFRLPSYPLLHIPHAFFPHASRLATLLLFQLLLASLNDIPAAVAATRKPLTLR